MLYSMRSVPDIEKMLANFKFETTKTDNGNGVYDFVGLTDEFGKELEDHAMMIGKNVTIVAYADDPKMKLARNYNEHPVTSDASMES